MENPLLIGVALLGSVGTTSSPGPSGSNCKPKGSVEKSDAHNGCCRRAAQTRALSSVLWKLLTSENLQQPLSTIEMPMVNVLADMELSGIGVDMDGCIQSHYVLGKKLRYLEKEAYRLAGTRFSLYTTADIADALYTRIKLTVPQGYQGKNHPSTDKHCL